MLHKSHFNSMLDDRSVYIAGYARTPIGSFQGALSALSGPELGAHAISAAVARSNVPASAVEEVYMGNVLSANEGQAPARQAAIKAGCPIQCLQLRLTKYALRD